MKVHHIINSIALKEGGAQRLVRQFHTALRERGIESRIVALCGTKENIEGSVFLENSSPYSWRSLISITTYISQQCDPEDIIHVHLFPSLLHVSLAVRLLRWQGRLVCTEHNTSNRRRSHPFGKIIDRLIYPSYQRIYCISTGTANAIGEWMPQQARKLETVENGVSLPYTTFYERPQKERVIIASAGRLHTQKNYTAALQALALLREQHTDIFNRIEYRIAGSGEQAAALKTLSSELSLENCVKFYGYVDDIVSFYKAADIFLMPSKWEGFGLAAVEAMNTGLPVVASDVAGLREICETSPACGILVSPQHPEEIVEAIVSLMDLNQRAALGKGAFKRSLAFSIERMVDLYLRKYSQLCSVTSAA